MENPVTSYNTSTVTCDSFKLSYPRIKRVYSMIVIKRQLTSNNKNFLRLLC